MGILAWDSNFFEGSSEGFLVVSMSIISTRIVSPVIGSPIVEPANWASASRPLPERAMDVTQFSGLFKKKSPHARQTSLIASIGPASNKPEVIEKMMRAGANVFRLNFAHGTLADHGKTIDMVRAIAQELQEKGQLERPVRLMADLPGPRMNIGHLSRGSYVNVIPEAPVQLTPMGESWRNGVLSISDPKWLPLLQPGHLVLINDGRVRLEVERAADAASGGAVKCKVLKGGRVSSGDGINIPNLMFPTPTLTETDKEALRFALSKDVDIMTQSYVQTEQDVLAARQLIQESGKNPELIAKIERPTAVAPGTLRKIVSVADGVMVARGDLATETGLINLPELQQRIITEATRQGKPVIVANRMLANQIHSAEPERNDVIAVADAVKSQVNGIMLAHETSSGMGPVHSVRTLDRIIRHYESDTSTWITKLRRGCNKILFWIKQLPERLAIKLRLKRQ